MKIRFIFLLTFTLCILGSCADREDCTSVDNNETMVEMTFLNHANTRGLTTDDLNRIAQGTEDERRINTLDLLVFKDDKFQYRRNAVKHPSDGNNVFRATLKADVGLTVHFIANARDMIEDLMARNQIVDGSADNWDIIRAKLVDDHAERFVESAADRSDLPMWGTKSGLDVTEGTIAHWTGINLLRAVAGVDIYLDEAIDNFTLTNAYLYFVPNKGCYAPSAANYIGGGSANPESVSGMKTSLTLGPVNASDRKIANFFYLYDNDTDESTFTSEGANIRRYTRVVVGGVYNSKTYYYPIDFLIEDGNETIRYDKITRNTKYLFQIVTVSGPGYTTPEIASVEPPVHMTTHIYNWNLSEDNHAGFDGKYYISLDKKAAVLARVQGSTDRINLTTNANPGAVTIDFTTIQNGEQQDVEGGKGIKNDRFLVEKVLDDEGNNIVGLKVTALGNYDPASPAKNKDAVVVRAGNIEFAISITQLSSSPGDWDNGGEEVMELTGNN